MRNVYVCAVIVWTHLVNASHLDTTTLQPETKLECDLSARLLRPSENITLRPNYTHPRAPLAAEWQRKLLAAVEGDADIILTLRLQACQRNEQTSSLTFGAFQALQELHLINLPQFTSFDLRAIRWNSRLRHLCLDDNPHLVDVTGNNGNVALPNLEIVSMRNTGLRAIPRILQQFNTTLKELYITGKWFNTTAAMACDMFPALMVFNDIPCISVIEMKTTAFVLVDNKTLFNGYLSLSHLPVTDRLIALHIEDCDINSVDNVVFIDLVYLETVILTRNHLQTLNVSSNSIRRLDLSYNRIETVENCHFDRMPELVVLNLTGNHLLRVEWIITLKNLAVVDLSANFQLQTVYVTGIYLRRLNLCHVQSINKMQLKARSLKLLDVRNTTFTPKLHVLHMCDAVTVGRALQIIHGDDQTDQTFDCDELYQIEDLFYIREVPQHAPNTPDALKVNYDVFKESLTYLAAMFLTVLLGLLLWIYRQLRRLSLHEQIDYLPPTSYFHTSSVDNYHDYYETVE